MPLTLRRQAGGKAWEGGSARGRDEGGRHGGGGGRVHKTVTFSVFLLFYVISTIPVWSCLLSRCVLRF